MTGTEALRRLEDLGARFTLAADGTIDADLPEPEPAAMGLYLAQLKAHRAEAVQALRRRDGNPLPACSSCSHPVATPGDFLCQSCYLARRGPGVVLDFALGRRGQQIMRGRLYRPCSGCQTVNWYVNPRGDAICRTCAEPGTIPTETEAGEP